MTGCANAWNCRVPPVDARRRRSALLSPAITIAGTHTSALIVTRPMISIIDHLTLLQPVFVTALTASMQPAGWRLTPACSCQPARRQFASVFDRTRLRRSRPCLCIRAPSRPTPQGLSQFPNIPMTYSRLSRRRTRVLLINTSLSLRLQPAMRYTHLPALRFASANALASLPAADSVSPPQKRLQRATAATIK